MKKADKSQTSVVVRKVSNPFDYIQPRLIKDNARLSLNQAGLAIMQKAEEEMHPQESVSIFSTFEEVKKLVEEDKGRVRAIRKFCEDSNVTLFMYNIPRKRFPYVAGLHNHRINDLPQGKTQYLFLD